MALMKKVTTRLESLNVMEWDREAWDSSLIVRVLMSSVPSSPPINIIQPMCTNIFLLYHPSVPNIKQAQGGLREEDWRFPACATSLSTENRRS